uniref:Kunitz/Bovine pancreatic trypsin inhibitor domain protein n=1 Tax=Syphacia muris TaxID=451379 RepID=A0A0N5AV83_9BILA
MTRVSKRSELLSLKTKRLEQHLNDKGLCITTTYSSVTNALLECDPSSGEKKPNPDDPQSYLYCSLEGSFTKKNCPEGTFYVNASMKCEPKQKTLASSADDPILYPQNQAPDDLCGDGIPMTRLSAPVICNPSISSCPDARDVFLNVFCYLWFQSTVSGYECTVYARTGTAYCCQNPTSSASLLTTESGCPLGQVAYIDVSLQLLYFDSCPVGFTCNLVSDGSTRCCGKQFGCPFNSAALINLSTAKHVPCSMDNRKSCPKGFSCKKSSYFGNPICCSNVEEESKNSCPNGKRPLSSSKACSRSSSCPKGYFCNQGSCCQITANCPVGIALNIGSVTCSDKKSCPEGYECVKSDGQNYCCPSPGLVCTLPKNTGMPCNTPRSPVTKYYYDISSGRCLPFQFTQCGGNDNKFDSLDQCLSFCATRQCPTGIPYITNGSSALCTPTAANTCPEKYSCQKPLYGSNFICCPTPELCIAPELSCNEMVSAGTACFGQWMSETRYYYDTDNKKCQRFEYFGCSGGNNNFLSKHSCEHNCLNQALNACNGVAPLSDPNSNLQRCSKKIPCPTGYICNKKQFCCPIPPFACSSPMSSGNVCSKAPQTTAWYYDPDIRNCVQFAYFGCGGTANRFVDRKSCVSTCVGIEELGECPKGMSPYFESGSLNPKKCTLNVAGICPSPSSCVRSTLNNAICCQTTAKCPRSKKPYIIPGSDSTISCQPELDNCPNGFECSESSIRGFYMCCTTTSEQPLTVVKKAENQCPNNARSSGDYCTVNSVGECPDGYTCIAKDGDNPGLCCSVQPKCKRGTTHFVAPKQAQICGPELAGCPQGMVCALSTVSSVNVCCRMPSSAVPKFHSISPTPQPVCSDGKTPFYERGSVFPKQCITSLKDQCPKNHACKLAKSGGLFYCCPVPPNQCINGQKAMLVPGTLSPRTCSFEANNCPRGYSCRQSADSSSFFCCTDKHSMARCPLGSSEYLYGNRALACPPGSNKCPAGYNCVESDIGDVHLCCSGSIPQKPMCRSGFAYINPSTNLPQECFPPAMYCPTGYYCQQSTVANHTLCCTAGRFNERYDGYCPIGQIPYVSKTTGVPRTCHMTLNPCPNAAPYTCIYSSEKQESFCCAPLDTAVRTLPAVPNREFSSIYKNFLSLQGRFLRYLGSIASGCPAGSSPLITDNGMLQQCNPGLCPPSYNCYPGLQFKTWQCCSEEIIYRKAPKPTESKDCELGSVPINGRCMRLYYIGQKGCQVNEQCSLKLPEARCERNYCSCPRHKLIHGSKCVTHCPDGFINIAARCHDLTTVVFMDSVESRKNGTIGGFCKETIVEEEQCDVKNAYCNEKSITCQCKPGFELNMNFEDGNDTGSCTPLKDSKFANNAPKVVDDEAVDDIFYFVDASTDISNETETNNASVLNTALNDTEIDINRYLFQTD